MQEFNHIEAIWAQHKVDIKISADDMLKQVKKEVGSIRTRSILNILGMMASIVVLAALWILVDFQSVFTHIGLSIIVIAVTVYTFILFKNHQIISKTDFTADPSLFLQNLKSYQINRFSLYNKLYWFYIIALSLGMALYFLEIMPQLKAWVQASFVVLSFGWVIFCSTLVRKAVIKRDRERISLLIEKFTRLSEQFKGQ